MTTHYLVDVSWMLYRGYYAAGHVWEEFPEIHFLVKKIESWLSRQDTVVHLALDGWNTKGKRLLGEQYKSGRHQGVCVYNVYTGLATFVSLLHTDRIHVYFNNDYESDEIIFTLSRTLEGRKRIISGDKDLLQSLKPDVIIESAKGLITTHESYIYEYADKFLEVPPEKLPIFRAIAGDPSDSLKPPVPRFPHKLAAKLINTIDYNGECPTIEQLNNLKSSGNYSDSELRWIDKLIESYTPFNLNFNVMKLNVITDDISNKYRDSDVEFSDFLKQKVLHLNTI